MVHAEATNLQLVLNVTRPFMVLSATDFRPHTLCHSVNAVSLTYRLKVAEPKCRFGINTANQIQSYLKRLGLDPALVSLQVQGPLPLPTGSRRDGVWGLLILERGFPYY